MLFQLHRPSNHLQQSLKAAIASHRPAALKIMFDHHGERVFAQALSVLSKRAIADALSMLPASDRSCAQKHLPKSVRLHFDVLQPLDPEPFDGHACAHRPRNHHSSAMARTTP